MIMLSGYLRNYSKKHTLFGIYGMCVQMMEQEQIITRDFRVRNDSYSSFAASIASIFVVKPLLGMKTNPGFVAVAKWGDVQGLKMDNRNGQYSVVPLINPIKIEKPSHVNPLSSTSGKVEERDREKVRLPESKSISIAANE